ncbi:gliding motility-associated C-terminal domain-containing protein [Desertivirga xinjiangensis]|uniref:gliding motility-associated C-terminal domain-containing protein n=1 Tax=Desertivirga xinjiangensis TaxID=539206 RepID=UPI00210EC54F|nr:gliding motility-associated C-terminal domain-containing protein [Pedobacter xinjiangensis]
MLRLKLILILTFIFVVIKHASSETIVVTSNADTGPNTLRWAIQRTLDNDTTETDYIHFNISSSDRTIRLRTQLPRITSNVVIDGSTQPGAALGPSGAKVIIEAEQGFSGFAGLIVGPTYNNTTTYLTNNVEIYGLCIRRFGLINNLSSPGSEQSSGIIIDSRVNNLRIGKPGKGNVICGNFAGISMRNGSGPSFNGSLGKIYIQSNFIGLLLDGATEQINYYGLYLNPSDYNILIGGDNPGEGNVISANATGIYINRQNTFGARASFNIIGNKIGTDLNVTRDYNELPVFIQSSTVDMNGVKIIASNTDLTLLKNVISGQNKWAVSITNSDFLIAGNRIGTGNLGTENFGNFGGIRIEPGTAKGTIGGPAPEDINYIGNNRFGIETASSQPIQITQNSIFCNEVFGIGETLTAQQAYVQVLKIRPDHISGKASPNAQVELYYTDNCASSCQGKTYFASQRAGNDGRWEYNGPLTGHVTATATLPSAVTSPFSTVALRSGDAVVDPVVCNALGKITITEPREGIIFKWYKLETDADPILIPGDLEISGLEVGTYRLLMSDGCKEMSHVFAIDDKILTPPTVSWPSPQCGQTSFQFSASTLRGKGTIIYEWLDENGNLKAKGQTVQMPEGKYRLRIKDQANCEQFSAFEQITKRPQPVISTTMMVIKPAACGMIDGAITGIAVTPGVGTATYKWYRLNAINGSRETMVSQNLNLQGVDGGRYQLEVTDQSNCSPIYSASLTINILQSVKFSGGTTSPSTCNSPNGSINNVSITNANEYEWLTSSGVSIEKNAYSTGMVLELKNKAPGTYKLRAQNTLTGCIDSTNFTIYQENPVVYQYSVSTIPTTCGLINGSIKLNYPFSQRFGPAHFEWRDVSGNVLSGSFDELKNLPPGEYRYYTFDENNCMDVSDAIIINETPLLKIRPATASVTDDGCTLMNGAVRGIEVIGGVPPYKYKWIDQNDKEVGYAQDLTGVSLGDYRLIVSDQTSCGTDVSEVYSVVNPEFFIPAPEVSDLRVCYKTEIMLPVKNPEPGTYQLFALPSDEAPIQESTKGIFTFEVAKTSDYYIKRKRGTCYSEFTMVRIEVINDNLKIMNAMTPNADGKNDDWIIQGLPENNNDMTIHVYNRDGQLMYESVGAYDRKFDGTFIGNPLPKGVYYYKIDLKSGCKPLVGSITLLR